MCEANAPEQIYCSCHPSLFCLPHHLKDTRYFLHICPRLICMVHASKKSMWIIFQLLKGSTTGDPRVAQKNSGTDVSRPRRKFLKLRARRGGQCCRQNCADCSVMFSPCIPCLSFALSLIKQAQHNSPICPIDLM